MRSIKPTEGTVIRATHRPEDLLPALVEACIELDILHDVNLYDSPLCSLLASKENQWGIVPYSFLDEDGEETQNYLNSEECGLDIDELFYTLDGHANNFDMRFGTIEGDSSDFGFWKVEEETED